MPNPALKNEALSMVAFGIIFNTLKMTKIKTKKDEPTNMDSKIACPALELMWSFFSMVSMDIVSPP